MTSAFFTPFPVILVEKHLNFWRKRARRAEWKPVLHMERGLVSWNDYLCSNISYHEIENNPRFGFRYHSLDDLFPILPADLTHHWLDTWFRLLRFDQGHVRDWHQDCNPHNNHKTSYRSVSLIMLLTDGGDFKIETTQGTYPLEEGWAIRIPSDSAYRITSPRKHSHLCFTGWGMRRREVS